MNSPLDDFDLDSIGIVAETAMADVRKDPLKWFRYSSEAQRKVVRYAATHEVALRSGNQAGKTTIAAYFVVAMLRGESELDGIKLPPTDSPSVWGVLGKSYKQMADSSIKALQQAIGDWPHKIERGSQGTVTAIWVKPNGWQNDNYRTWSKAIMLPQDGEKPVGLRLDGAWADEPPKWDYWMELRARGRANRPFYRIITFTPEDRREWEPIRFDFAGCEEPGADGKVELRMSVFDNKALSSAHLKGLELAWKNDPLIAARLYGDWIDTTGACPFDAEGLARWEKRCRPPASVLRIGQSEGYRDHFDVEVWWEPEDGEQYMVVADPSSGTKDATKPLGQQEHDPAGVVVIARSSRRLVARWNGYAPAHRVGRLCAELGTRYNRSLVVWERNSGYGESFYLGLGGYGNVYIDHRHDSLHLNLSERMGWATTATTRGVIIGALQKAVLEDGLVMLSRAALENLRSVVMDPMGRIAAAPTFHDEDMIVLGLACHLLETMPFYRQEKAPSESVPWEKNRNHNPVWGSNEFVSF